MPHLFCFGMGYSGTTIAHQLAGKDWKISGTSQTDKGCKLHRQNGIQAYRFNAEEALDDVHVLDDVTHLLLSIPPQNNEDIVLEYYSEILPKLSSLEWVGYLSTTGVYGDHQGNWVDENSAYHPVNHRSLARIQAEEKWLSAGLPAHIFHLSGIYGGKRNALIELQSGRARCIDKKGQVFSRIHVEDIAQTVIASMQNPFPGEIYNLADDLPAAQPDVVHYAASLLKMSPPPLQPFETADLSPMARSFYGACRRMRNTKIKDILGVSLKYPTYKEGLNACLKGCK